MTDAEFFDPPDWWDTVRIEPGQYITHASASADWWELVIGWGPDGRMITVTKENKIQRYSDPTDQWEIIDTPDDWQRDPRGFTALDRRTTPDEEG